MSLRTQSARPVSAISAVEDAPSLSAASAFPPCSSFCPSLAHDRGAALSSSSTRLCTPVSKKSPVTTSTPGIASIGSKSTATTTPLPRNWRCFSAATWLHPPGAAPRSTTRRPRIGYLPARSLSLNAERARYAPPRDLTKGSRDWRASQRVEDDDLRSARVAFIRSVLCSVHRRDGRVLVRLILAFIHSLHRLPLPPRHSLVHTQHGERINKTHRRSQRKAAQGAPQELLHDQLLVRIMKWKVYGRQLLPGGFVGFLHGLGFVASIFIWRWFVEIGTPTRNAKGDLRVPQDLGAGGVIEVAWDVIYITWICTLGGALLGNWVWWLSALVPCFVGSKLFGVAKPFLGMFLPGLFGPKAPKEEAPVAAGGQPGESRKQAKLRARAEKGDRRVQSVRR